jgi:hypothetical protein
LRDPIQRLLSHYNFSLVVSGNPHHHELRSGKMSFLDYAEWLIARNSVGPQYSFFDDTGAGTFAYTSASAPEKCLDNLFNKIGLFGFTDRFHEFCILFGYLLRRPNIVIAPDNDSASFANGQSLKSSLTPDEQLKIEKVYADDIWFFAEALKEYERRIADPRIQAVLRSATPQVRRATELLQELRKS